MTENFYLRAQIPDSLTGQRLDQALPTIFSDYSRGRFQTWIKTEAVRVNGIVISRPRERVRGGEIVEVSAINDNQEIAWLPEALPLSIVYMDEALLVVNKPAAMVVHPAVGNHQGTLVNALLYYAPELVNLPRAGLIHRLDKDTTGLLVVARTLAAHYALVEQLKAREFIREYEGIVNGVLTSGGKIEAPIGRHPRDRKRMAVVTNGRPAFTHYRIIQRFKSHTHVRINLETGRTHQIRVHFDHLHYQLVGDPIYGGRARLPPNCSTALATALQNFNRQALHAMRLGLNHPITGEKLIWESPLPNDMQQLLTLLKN